MRGEELSIPVLLSHLCGSPVLPAGSDVSDDAGVALLAYVDAVHLDDALARVEAGDGCHRAWRETRGKQRENERRQGQQLLHVIPQVQALSIRNRVSLFPFPVHNIQLNNIPFFFLLCIYNFVSCCGSSGWVWGSMGGGEVVYLGQTRASLRDGVQTFKVYSYQKEVHGRLNIPPICFAGPLHTPCIPHNAK